jgi:hypothetical protein
VKKTRLPQYLFAVSAVLFGICSVLQFTAHNAALGVVFALIALIGVGLFVLLRSGRITW